jgi:hypothetical protein
LKHEEGEERHVGDSAFRIVKDNLDAYPLSSSSNKWDDVELLLHYGLERSMQVEPEDYALMIARNNVIQTPSDEYKLLELCFEKLRSPAVFCMSSAALSAFSAARPTALVLDLGAAATTVTPVIDGYALRKASVQSAIGGELLDHLMYYYISHELKLSLNPWYHRKPSQSPAQAQKVRASYQMLHIFDIVRDVKAWMCFIPAMAGMSSHGAAELSLPPAYELPDGALLPASYTLSTLPEQLYFPATRQPGTQAFVQAFASQQLRQASYCYYTHHSIDLVSANPAANTTTTTTSATSSTAGDVSSGRKRGRDALISPEQESLAELVANCLAETDADFRRDLAGNLLLVGGGAALAGLDKRLYRELQDALPSHVKVKLASNLAIERRHSAWIGGSIVSICGSFHQLWASRQEYEEQGAQRIVASRFLH